MNKNDVIRAWKDPFYRASLSEEAQAALPQHPAGVADLTDGQIRTLGVSGGTTTAPLCTNYTYGGLSACCPAATTSPLCTNYTYNGLAACCPTTTA